MFAVCKPRLEARMEGFLVFNFAHKREHARQRMAAWTRSGDLRYNEDAVEGIENAARVHRHDAG